MKSVIIVFVLSQLLMAALAWIGGFNFDTRSPDVAIFCAFSIWVGVILSGFVLIQSKG